MKKLLLLLPLLWIGYQVSAQDIPAVTSTILLKNAIVTSAPGIIDSASSILIKDGLIIAVGRQVTVPFDARVVDMDSLYIYPGFIAAASQIGIPKPKEEERKKIARPGYPTNAQAGIKPEQLLSSSYNAKEGSIKSFRKEGFTIAHAVPYGKMLPGKTAVFSLSGAEFNKAVITEDFGTYLQMKGSRGMFPGTEIGVMAKWRELYKNAALSSNQVDLYKRNPSGKKRPDMSPAVAGLHNVVKRKQAVIQPASKHVNISRAITMKKEMGYDLVLTDVKQAHMAYDMIKRAGVKVLFSLDLPKEIKEKDKTKEAKKDSSTVEKVLTWKEKEKAAMEVRKKKSVDQYVSQAAMAAKQQIPVAFSYVGVKSKDVHSSIRRLIKGGLSEKDALAALTTVPAKTLGLSQIAGTITNNKMANMVVMTGPLFDEKSKIKMVIVDGVIHEYDVKKKKKKKKGDGDDDMDITGDWTFVIEVPGLEPSGTIKITKTDDGTYDLVLTNSAVPGEELKVEGAELDGDEMSYTYTVNVQGINAAINSEVTYDGDTFEGTVDVGEFGSFKVSGQRTSKPE